MALPSRGVQLLILLAGGAVLGFGGCALFLGTANFSGDGHDKLGSVTGAVLFGVGLFMLAVGVLYAVVLILMKIFKSSGSAN